MYTTLGKINLENAELMIGNSPKFSSNRKRVFYENYGRQSYYFSIIENEDTQVGVNFSLDQCGDSIVLEYNIDYSSKIEGLEDKIDEVTDDELPAIGEFSSEHNSPLEVIRDNTSEVMDLIESKLHEIVDDLQSAGLL